jgi:2-polyprenyl-3-methyl-5-hydroxy-6-metoxy-1,4-benzoquinol methylase
MLDLSRPWDLIVLDRRSTSLAELRELQPYGPVAGLDEGGEARRYVVYLIDTLPVLRGAGSANVSSLGFLRQPRHQRANFGWPLRKVLVTFGGEDYADLSGRLVKRLLPRINSLDCELSLVQGPRFRRSHWPEGIKVFDRPERLREQLHRFDLVVTSFGLTCFESLFAGVAVVLFNPSRYHRRLSRSWRIPEIGAVRPNIRKLLRLMGNREVLEGTVARVGEEMEEDTPSLSDHLKTLKAYGRNSCPVCGAQLNRAVARLPRRTYFRCQSCRTIYQLNLSAEDHHYDDSYFSDEYRRQYGRTYLEDFDYITGLAGPRLEEIGRLGGRDAVRSLLDVGCAYGPFLYAAKEIGLEVRGIDVFADAVNHVRNRLRIPAACVSFKDYDGPGADAITMWFVIEHLSNLGEMLLKVNLLLPQGGVFAFSTPNLGGISARKGKNVYLKGSPADHRILWGPGIARRILEKNGFRVRRTRITGHHPERFPFCSGIKKRGLAWRAIRGASRLFKLGDTFEIYAVKDKDVRRRENDVGTRRAGEI